MYDVAIVGGGIAGVATAARLQRRGLSTIVLEAHGQPGGCAGFFRRRGFSFDVGATTLVDFGPGGVGGALLEEIGSPPLEREELQGYVAWMPDRVVTLDRDPAAWAVERARAFGDSPAHREFWALLDHLAAAFWRASRRGVKLPIQGVGDAIQAVRALGLRNLGLARYLNWTLADALKRAGLADDRPLVAILGMLVENAVHSTVADAPLVNAALGVTIWGAGQSRAKGGMRGFWQALAGRYRELGGELRVGRAVERVEGREGAFRVVTRKETVEAARLVLAVPIATASRIGPPGLAAALAPYRERDDDAAGGAVVVYLGVPESEVAGQPFQHHLVLEDYDEPLGDGNNMFISVSGEGDLGAAPAGCRTVVMSTHCELGPWEGLSPDVYAARKQEAGERLIGLARRVYPDLGRNALVREFATPATYERYTRRPRGAVGGAKLSLANANQNAVPQDVGVAGVRLAGDGTWPGLGTVACCLGSLIIADDFAGPR
ncbi:phytoene desaturase family protein [Planctomyces sp. SH-PL62]|uniref:phytoene desaturase family protein n=1 Tax=Planctomyces sp. SH-PL62 TaxID=1636152 RepID=UPI00078EDD6C|nr:NAD(P)/FAD-dependent oxidoreductase [Planctomyces sp. SH-PL62]AMV40297.1 Phytoene desaturase (lycopene-forming) [Planctomyces sp. SH-PL62]